jgi:hypothetical protein
MLSQVIRKGDKVVFARAHEHQNADHRTFLVEELLKEPPPPSTVPHVRIVSLDDSGWQIRPLEAIRHAMHTDVVDVTVAPGYLGNPDAWCWWEYEYPEDGVFGPFHTKDLAIEHLTLSEQSGGHHFHVSVLSVANPDEHYRRKHPQLVASLPAGVADPRKTMRTTACIGTQRANLLAQDPVAVAGAAVAAARREEERTRRRVAAISQELDIARDQHEAAARDTSAAHVALNDAITHSFDTNNKETK